MLVIEFRISILGRFHTFEKYLLTSCLVQFSSFWIEFGKNSDFLFFAYEKLSLQFMTYEAGIDHDIDIDIDFA